LKNHFYGVTMLDGAEREVWLMPLGTLLDQWEIYKQFHGLAKAKMVYCIDDIIPFIIDDELKLFYYRGLREWPSERGYLKDTCVAAQDKFKKYLDYFRIGF